MSLSSRHPQDGADQSAYSAQMGGRAWLGALLIAAGAIAAYWTSLDGQFFLDDYGSIVNNPHIRNLWPPSEAMSLPLWWPRSYETVYGRPILSLSLALNYALLGRQPQQPWGYHVGNLGIHICSGLLLFGVVRRTLQLPRLREDFHNRAPWIALAVALIWTVHPLNTECITYIVQRAESLMGMLFLLTMYCFLRGTQSRQGTLWYVLAVVTCLLGMGTKEGMVALPVIVFLLDWLYVAGSARAAWKARWKVHAALMACWLYPIGFFLYSEPFVPDPGDVYPTPWEYALTQFRSILLYLRYSLFPTGLLFTYQMPTVAAWTDVIPEALVVLTLIGGTVWALARGHWSALLGAWFFLPLLPSSSILPTADNASLHRMYLSLMPIIVLIVIAMDHILLRICARSERARKVAAVGLTLVVVVVLGYLTSQRNCDYRSDAALWCANIRVEPNNGLWHNNLGRTLLNEGRLDEAIARFQSAIPLDPELAAPYAYLGSALRQQGNRSAAVGRFQDAVHRNPTNPEIHKLLGITLMELGRRDEGIQALLKMTELEPNKPETCLQLAQAYVAIGRLIDAEAACRAALRRNDRHAGAHNHLGVILAQLGRSAEAEQEYRVALQLDPEHVEALNNLGLRLIRLGRYQEAVPLYESALLRAGKSPDLHNNFGYALLQLGRTTDAIEHFQRALQADPTHQLALENLRIARARVGNTSR